MFYTVLCIVVVEERLRENRGRLVTEIAKAATGRP